MNKNQQMLTTQQIPTNINKKTNKYQLIPTTIKKINKKHQQIWRKKNKQKSINKYPQISSTKTNKYQQV